MSSSQQEYLKRINRVIDHIDQNINQELPLESLAEIAFFSPFYFQRIFKSFQGESPTNFVSRLRLEKAARQLMNEPAKPVSDIAFDCGFSSTSLFNRNFKKHFETSPGNFRKNRQFESKNRQSNSVSEEYVCLINHLKKRGFMNNIQIKNMPELKLIYCRHTGQFNRIDSAYEKLFKWAGPRGFLNQPDWKTVTVYHDDPNITEIENVRQDACITVTEEIKPEGEFGFEKVSEGEYAVGRFEIDEKGFENAWDAVCLWMSENGYLPDEGKPYELYHNDHTTHPERKFILDICVPAKPM